MLDGKLKDIDKVLQFMQRILDIIASSDDSIHRLQKANEFASQMQIVHHKLQATRHQITELELRPEFNIKVQDRTDSLRKVVEHAIDQFDEHPIISHDDLSIETFTTMSVGEKSPLLANPQSNPYLLLSSPIPMHQHHGTADASPSMQAVFKQLFSSITNAQKQLTDAHQEGEMYAKTQLTLHKDRKRVITGCIFTLVALAIIISYVVVLLGH